VGLHDRTGLVGIRLFSHVRLTHPRHAYYGSTGTVVRIDQARRRVWVNLPSGTIVAANHRSVEVLVPRAER
jgi:ribosomal protein L21E